MTDKRVWKNDGLTVRYQIGRFRDALAYGLEGHRHTAEEDDTLYITRVASDGRRTVTVPARFGGDGAKNLVFDGTVLEGDESVRVLRLPETRTWFEVYAFGVCCVSGCPHLEEVFIGNGTLALPSRLFHACPALRAVHLPESLRYIEPHTYTGRRLWDSGDRNDPDVEEFKRAEALGAPGGVVFYVRAGSYAHEYAKANGVAFELEPEAKRARR